MFEIVKDAMKVNGAVVDGVIINGKWMAKTPTETEISTENGYRVIRVGEKKIQLHRTIHEIGRPNLLAKVKDFAKLFD